MLLHNITGNTLNCLGHPDSCIHRLKWLNLRNSRHLYKLIVEITGSKVENPLPEGLPDGDLAECFVIFFITKTENSRDNLNSHPLHNLTDLQVTAVPLQDSVVF